MKQAYINGILLDGSREMEPRAGQVILTEGSLITAVEPQGADLAGYEVVDLAGGTIMPGLINLHVHLPASGKPKKKQADNAKLVRLITGNALFRALGLKLCEGYAKQELMSGVTTIRTVGGVADFDTKIRDLAEQGKIAAPRVLAANMAVSVPGGHMAGSLAYEAHSAEEARAYVAKIAAESPDLIKLMITGGVLDATKKGEPGELKMQPELVRAACEEAHRRDLKVAAHVESPEGVRVALENGVDTIEHGAKTDEEILRLFKEKKACHVATLSPALPYALFDRSLSYATELSQYNGRVVFDGIIDCAKKCLENDIPVGLGTDTGCPYITHYNMWRELEYFHKYCGVSNRFALYTATRRNAEIAGIADRVGAIAPGLQADFVVTQANPLENLEALRNISMVVCRGRRYERPVVKKDAGIEAALDQYR